MLQTKLAPKVFTLRPRITTSDVDFGPTKGKVVYFNCASTGFMRDLVKQARRREEAASGQSGRKEKGPKATVGVAIEDPEGIQGSRKEGLRGVRGG